MAEVETKTAGNRNNFVQAFQAIPLGKKISLAVILLALIGGFTALFLWTNRPDYQVLFSNLDSSDAGRIMEKLREKRIPFKLKDGGSAIFVPDDQVYELRLEFASQGLPQGRNIGFEVFDNMPFGTTEFVQKLKYQQALQGELARTIMGFDAVAQARVHIVTANESLFVEPSEEGSASVVLKLHPGRSLDRRQLQGIVNLVACAVKGLKPENITVVDMEGGLLFGGNQEQELASMTQSQFEYKRRLEQTLEQRIKTMLEPVVGRNMVVARVTADLDFKQVTITEENFDPDSAVVRSEQRSKEKTAGSKSLPSGSPDLKFEIYQGGGGAGGVKGQSFEKEDTVINYEISRVNRQIVNGAGEIKRLSVAVIIDGPYKMEKDEAGKEIRTFVPRSRKEMKTFEDIVKKAMGFNENRGDQLTISNIPFAIQKSIPLPSGEPVWMNYLKKAARPLFNVILIALLFLFVIKPFKKWVNEAREFTGPAALPQGESVPQLPAGTSGGGPGQLSKEDILDITKSEPEKIADIIRAWIREGS